MNDTTAESVATIGDNNPPDKLITGADLEAYLATTYATNLERALALLEKGQEFLVINGDQADEDATEFLVKLRACWTKAEAARKDEKTPYDDAAGLVHAFFKKPILDPLGLAPDSKAPFDPVERTDLGLGPRIAMAQTLWKKAKVDAERKKREEEARRAREAEEAARRQRMEEERVAREAEDKRRREAEEAERKAREEARQAELAASRKRSDESRAKAEAEAVERRRQADEASRKRQEEDRIAIEERTRREQANREAENKLAEERAAAEAAASVSSADLSRARGARGGVSSLKEWLEVRDTDRDTLDYAAIGPYFTDKAVDQAIHAWLNANKGTVNAAIKNGTQPLRGTVFYNAQKSASRR